MEQNINPSIQRRDFPRYYTNQPFLIEITSTKNLIQTKGKTVNISKHGLCVRLDKEISVAERVDLNISLDENRNLNNKARVIWSDPKLALYGIDMTEYKETVPDYWDGYLAGMKTVEVERRIKRERREKREVKNHDTRKSERRLEYPFFAKLKKMKMYQDLIKADNFSYLRETQSSSENIITMEGQELINLGSNNYLGMTTHPEVKKVAIQAIEKYGVGSGGVRFLSGTMDLHNELERRLAKFKGGEDCVVFSTGYTMNVATISLLANQNDFLVVDKKAHASIIDGCKLSGANTIIYKHNDMNDLEKILKKLGTDKSKMIITDGVFSMDGDIAPLDEIYKIGKK
jgi:hypothetical protein